MVESLNLEIFESFGWKRLAIIKWIVILDSVVDLEKSKNLSEWYCTLEFAHGKNEWSWT